MKKELARVIRTYHDLWYMESRSRYYARANSTRKLLETFCNTLVMYYVADVISDEDFDDLCHLAHEHLSEMREW